MANSQAQEMSREDLNYGNHYPSLLSDGVEAVRTIRRAYLARTLIEIAEHLSLPYSTIYDYLLNNSKAKLPDNSIKMANSQAQESGQIVDYIFYTLKGAGRLNNENNLQNILEMLRVAARPNDSIILSKLIEECQAQKSGILCTRIILGTSTK